MPIIRKSARNQLGDTIVEVMLVLAVLGFAIGISYATANRSLLHARQAQENSQATTLVQSQAEALWDMAANPSTSSDYIYVSPLTTFCVGVDRHKATGAACDQGEGNRYRLAIRHSNHTFTITATWNNVLGEGQDSVTLLYRIHPPS